MKINKRNPMHWLILLWSGALLILVLPLRLLKPLKKQQSVVMYGHKLNGNLLALYEFAKKEYPELSLGYLSIDPAYIKEARKEYEILSGLNIADVARLVLCDAIIADHGLHHFKLLQKVTGIKFIDVWHGIPYKGFDAEDFSHLHPYDQVWVSSQWMKDLYVQRLGFQGERVKVTGYARADRLRNYPMSRAEALKKYALSDAKTLLIAPTWKQDAQNRSIVPYGLRLDEFFKVITDAYGEDLQIIFRAHLNVNERHGVESTGNIKIMPYADYPIAEDFLIASDVVLTDWSSIAFDSLAIDQPVVFMDVPAPFKKGFCIEPKYRFGAKAANSEELKTALHEALTQPQTYLNEHQQIAEEAKEIAYGDTLDGKVCQRSFDFLFALLDNKK